MTRAQALKRARERWGKTAFVTLRRSAIVGEERDILAAEFRKVCAEKPSRPAEFRLVADRTWYNQRYSAWRKERDELQMKLIVRRCGVGYVHDSFLGPIQSTNGSGDTWGEACEHARI